MALLQEDSDLKVRDLGYKAGCGSYLASIDSYCFVGPEPELIFSNSVSLTLSFKIWPGTISPGMLCSQALA